MPICIGKKKLKKIKPKWQSAFNCACRWFKLEPKNAVGSCDCTCAWVPAMS